MDRQTAYKTSISEIVSGKYVVEDGWQPNYIELKNGKKTSRINIICVVVSKEDRSITADDGTGSITVRAFEDNNIFSKVSVGDTIILIGRPREYNNEKYIAPEIIKKVEDKRWLEVRKKELTPEQVKETEDEKPCGIEEDIIKIIRALDTGNGADTGEIAERAPNGEEKIKRLLEQGEIFEIRPGKVKILE